MAGLKTMVPFCGCGCGKPVRIHRGRPNTYLHNHQTRGQELVPRKKCAICGKYFYAPPIQIRRGGAKFCSKICYARFVSRNPELYPRTQTRRGSGGRRADLENKYFRSSWEANYARYLNFLVRQRQIVSWSFEAESFEFPVKRGTRFYTPDFKVVNLNGSVEYHEIKGWMDQRSRTKLNRMKKHHPHIKLLLIEQRAYYEIAHKVGPLIPGWERVRGKWARLG